MNTLLKDINKKIEQLLNEKIIESTTPPQGMDSTVYFIKTELGKEYAIKYSDKGLLGDKKALELINEHHINIPVPELVEGFRVGDTTVIVLKKINYPLLESVPVNQMDKYIPSMIDNLSKIHQITSGRCGLLSKENEMKKNWQELLLSMFANQEYGIDWDEVISRDGLDSELVDTSVKNIIKKIKQTDFDMQQFSLLHTDFNQRNLFIDPNSDQISGIIDWAESMFGDPLLDFARVRMYIWHFGLEEKVLSTFDKLLNLSDEQKELSKLYWVIRVIEYLAYYSEELNKFNTNRIKLHQKFLRGYQWNFS